jgi:hypothetical protein
MAPIRYIPASDVSVIGNGVWTSRNQPYGAIISYWLDPALAGSGNVQLVILDAANRTVRTQTASARAGLNRATWNLAETSACAADAAPAPVAGGRGGRGGRGGGGTWVRAIPGDYRVRVTAAGETQESTFTVRPDPYVDTTPADYAIWHREARKIERMECMIDRGSARVRALDRQLAELEASAPSAIRADATRIRAELRPLILGFNGDAGDPGHVNLSGRVNWLTIQVGNYSGRPTPAQMEWIDRWARMTDEYSRALDAIEAASLTRLNDRLRAAGLPPLRGEG